MFKFIYFNIIFLVFYLFTSEPYLSFVFSLFISLVINFFVKSNSLFALREFILLLYSLNYLVSPTISYLLTDKISSYNMKLSPSEYFNLAIPGFIFFYVGLYSIKTNLFILNFEKTNISSFLNVTLLKKTTIFCIFLSVISSSLPGDLAFVFYLFSLLQYVASFSLFALNPKKYLIWPALTISILLYKSFLQGMYHDAVMWILFFCIFFVYILRPSLRYKLFGLFFISIFILFVQSIKQSYRQDVWSEGKDASIKTAAEIGYSKASTDILFGEENLLGSLSRSNQAWIFASTVENMNLNKNYQGLSNVYKYLEASLFPRFLAPDKIKSGDKEIFNAFSGHTINAGTSMGLGVFADGYIAYGAIGVYIFGFVLGLIFALTFKLVEGWTRISPYYVLLIFPLLNYAVRPDCELQTTINHLSKGIMLYGLIVWYTKKNFSFVIENPNS